MYRQFDLQSGNAFMTCWLKCDGTDGAKLREGVRLTLKHDPERTWSVVAMRSQIQREPPNRFWKIGGLV